MSKPALNISVVVTSPSGATRLSSGMFYPSKGGGGSNVLLTTQAHAVHTIQVEGDILQGQSHTVKGQTLKLVRRDSSLRLLLDDEIVVELLNFYETPGATLQGQGWIVEGMHGAVQSQPSPETFFYEAEDKSTADTSVKSYVPSQVSSVTTPIDLLLAESLRPPLTPMQIGLPGGALALGLASGGGKSAPIPVPLPLFDALVTLVGTVVLGPLVPTHDLQVFVYAADGTTLLGTTDIGGDGRYTLTLFNNNTNTPYHGNVLLMVRSRGVGVADHQDEARGQSIDMSSTLLAVQHISRQQSHTSNIQIEQSLHVNPITTFAAMLAGVSANGDEGFAQLPVQSITAGYDRAAALFGVSVADIASTKPTAINTYEFRTLEPSSAEYKLGLVLAAISGLEASLGSDTSTVLNRLFTELGSEVHSANPQWTQPALSLILKGAMLIENNPTYAYTHTENLNFAQQFTKLLNPNAGQLLLSTSPDSIAELDLTKLSVEEWPFLSADQVSALRADQVSTLPIESLAFLTKLHFERLGASQGTNPALILNMSTEQLTALSAQQVGFWALSDLQTNYDPIIKTLAGQGKLSSFGGEQITALGIHFRAFTAQQVAAFNDDQISGITLSQVQLNQNLFVDLTAAQLVQLPGDSFSYISTDILVTQFQAIEDFNLLKPSHLSNLSGPQAKAFADKGFFNELTPQQLVSLSWQSIEFVPDIIFSQLNADNFHPNQFTNDHFYALSAAQFNQLDGNIIREITFNQFQSIKFNERAGVDSRLIKYMHHSLFSLLPDRPFQSLTADEFSQFSSTQIAALSEGQAQSLANAGAYMQMSLDQLLSFNEVSFEYIPPNILLQHINESNINLLKNHQLSNLSHAQAQGLLDAGLYAYLSSASTLLLSKYALALLPIDQFNSLTIDEINRLSFTQIQGFNDKHTESMANDGRLYKLSSFLFSQLTPSAMGLLTAEHIPQFSDAQLQNLTSDQAATLAGNHAFDALASSRLSTLSWRAFPFVPVSVLLELNAQEVASLPFTHLTSLSKTQLQALIANDRHTELDGAVFSQINAASFSDLQATHVEKLTQLQLAALTRNQAIHIADNQAFDNLSTAQILEVSSHAFDYLPPLLLKSRLGAEQVAALKNPQLSQITAAQAAEMGSGAFEQLEREQLNALQPHTYPHLNNTALAKFSSDDIAGMTGSQFASFTDSQILHLASIDLLAELTPQSIATLGSRIHIFTGNSLTSTFTPEQLSQLTYTQVLGFFSNNTWKQFTAAYIQELPVSTLAPISAANIRHHFSADQIIALTSNQVHSIGQNGGFASLTHEQLTHLSPSGFVYLPGSFFNNYTADQLKDLSPSQISQLNRTHITQLANNQAFTQLSKEQFQAISSTHITALTTDQISSFTNDQLGRFSTAQITSLFNTSPNRFSGLAYDRLQYVGDGTDPRFKVTESTETTIATVTGVQNGLIKAGSIVFIQLEFNENIRIESPTLEPQEPTLTIQIGGNTRIATYDWARSNTMPKALVFTYSISSDDASSAAQGISVAANGLDLGGYILFNSSTGLRAKSDSVEPLLNDTTYIVDTLVTALTSAQILNDTGISSSDGMTRDSTARIEGIEPGATIEYRLLTAGGWGEWTSANNHQPINSATVDLEFLPSGSYADNTVQIRQTDAAGNQSDPIYLTWGFSGPLIIEKSVPEINSQTFNRLENHDVSESTNAVAVFTITQGYANTAPGFTHNKPFTHSFRLEGPDADLFEVRTLSNGSYGVYFKSSPDHERPLSQNGDNTYHFDVVASDQYGNSRTQNLSTTVQNVNEFLDPAMNVPSFAGVQLGQITHMFEHDDRTFYFVDYDKNNTINNSDLFDSNVYNLFGANANGLNPQSKPNETARYYRQPLNASTSLNMRLLTQDDFEQLHNSGVLSSQIGIVFGEPNQDLSFWTASPNREVAAYNNNGVNFFNPHSLNSTNALLLVEALPIL